MRVLVVLVAAAAMCTHAPASAQPARRDGSTELPDFGPRITIETIEVFGNTNTQRELILRVLPVAAGDVVAASDRRLRLARFKVLALGFFRDVRLVMRKGSQRGAVVLEVHVVERGTAVLNRLWFGTTDVSPYWVGADVGDRNVLGLGIALGAGFIFAEHGDVPRSRAQWATELRLADASVLGTRWGANAAMTIVRGSEVYRVGGDPREVEVGDLEAFSYRRFGGRVGTSYDLTALSTVSASVRLEQISAELPASPRLALPDGRFVDIDLHLDAGASRVATTGLAFDRDTRPDPVLPHSGSRLTLSGELGSSLFGGDYTFASVFGRYEHYWPLFRGKHAIGLRAAGGIVLGDAPRFERIHVADVNRMLTPRALGLVLSAAAPVDFLGTRADKPSYGDLGGAAGIEYAFTLFRGTGKNRVYGGDVFVGGGLWALAERARGAPGSGERSDNAIPIDVFVDAGIRIDTDVGVFEVTFANALGRLR